ncbi:hypothetical protein FB561_7034 [Kribbella amoyensis]|uniref:Uncharacterized protein n=1 Tax=Kribbella amoyensis TaxID=996641 RepID=A0A561B2Q9_9ACTN|nr:hypothetical protein [Kribbella amoyensis]TWD73149.1 hypothetical protein FB561_7034 [Kribbella amoyensis]
MIPVFSYPTLFGDVDLEVLSVTVDGGDLPYSKISRAERTVALDQAGRADWHSATLQLRGTIPDGEVVDGPWSDVSCLAILSEKATNARSTARLARGVDGRWHGAIELVRGSHSGRAILGLAAVATVGDVGGRVIGTARQDWYIDIQAADPIRQRAVDIVHADFADGEQDWLKPFKDSPWIVDTTGDIPTVYLNTGGVEGLLDILDGVGGDSAEKLLREVTASQIAQDAWTAMFHTAIADLEFDEDGTPLLPSGWRGQVLRMMLPDILPGRQLNDALYEINERRSKGFGWSGLQSSIQFAVGRRTQVTKKLTNGVRTVVRGDEGERR